MGNNNGASLLIHRILLLSIHKYKYGITLFCAVFDGYASKNVSENQHIFFLRNSECSIIKVYSADSDSPK